MHLQAVIHSTLYLEQEQYLRHLDMVQLQYVGLPLSGLASLSMRIGERPPFTNCQPKSVGDGKFIWLR